MACTYRVAEMGGRAEQSGRWRVERERCKTRVATSCNGLHMGEGCVCMLKRSGRRAQAVCRVREGSRYMPWRSSSRQVRLGQVRAESQMAVYATVRHCMVQWLCRIGACMLHVYVCIQCVCVSAAHGLYNLLNCRGESVCFGTFPSPWMDGWVPPGLRPQAFIVVFRLSKPLDVRWVDTRAPARAYGHARNRHTHNESGALVWAELGLSSVYRVKVLL
jgi:hypothetical protein